MELKNAIKEAVVTAKELGYSAETIERIRGAQSEKEITNILIDARNAYEVKQFPIRTSSGYRRR